MQRPRRWLAEWRAAVWPGKPLASGDIRQRAACAAAAMGHSELADDVDYESVAICSFLSLPSKRSFLGC